MALAARFAYDDCRSSQAFPLRAGRRGAQLGTFGETLRKEREKRGITLESVSEGTKIGTRFLRALEAGQFDQLPGGVFNKGFVRAYARHIGLDEDKTVADFMAASGQSAPDPGETTGKMAGAKEGPKPSRKGNADPIRITEASQPGENQQEEPIAREIPWAALAALLFLVIVVLAGARYAFHLRGPKAEPAHSSPVTSPHQAPSAPANPSLAPVSLSALQLVIHAREDSWLSITADGITQGEIMLLAGADKTVQADKDILLKAGNVGGLSFVWNGAKLPSQGEEGEVITLDFDGSGVRKVPPTTSPVTQP